MQRTIYLVGFMGSGKSHVGKKLANALYCPFIDLDTVIERTANSTIKDLFRVHGQAYFRLLERRALHDTAFGPPRVVATGGGAPCFFDNMAWINQHGLAIYLDATPEVLVERLWRGRAKRPLLNGLNQNSLLDFIKEKIAERHDFYELAPVHYHIHQAEQDSAGEILQHLEQITGH